MANSNNLIILKLWIFFLRLYAEQKHIVNRKTVGLPGLILSSPPQGKLPKLRGFSLEVVLCGIKEGSNILKQAGKGRRAFFFKDKVCNTKFTGTAVLTDYIVHFLSRKCGYG